MLNLFKRKKNENPGKTFTEIYSPADGKLIPIEEVQDEVFSKKMMGDGYAVVPDSGKIYSPVKGKIHNIFPTKHAFGIQTANSDEIILHLGVDTVELNGEPFTIFVKENEEVTPDTLIAVMNFEKMQGKDPTVIVAFANQDAIEKIILEEKEKVTHSEKVGKAVHK